MFNLYQQHPLFMWPLWSFFLPLLVILDVTLRGFALWRAARANQQWWFIALLVLNTMGILPAVYLFLIEPRQRASDSKAAPTTKPKSSKARQLASKK